MEKGVFASELDRDLPCYEFCICQCLCTPAAPLSDLRIDASNCPIVCLCPPNFPVGTRPNNYYKTTAGPSIDNLCIRGIRVCGYFIYWYCCCGCYVSEVLGIECVLSRFAVRLGWSLGRRVNRACAPFFSLIIAHRLPCLLLLISSSSFLTTTTATRPSALLSLSLDGHYSPCPPRT